MNTSCPHCSAVIEIDPSTHTTFAGHSHFACPACQGAVPVPVIARPRLQLDPPPGSMAAGPHQPRHSPKKATSASRSRNRNLLILGTTALLVLGGVAFMLASRKSGDTLVTTQNIRNEIIHNSYFQNLISTGETTLKDLNAIADIRPYEDGFIGISARPLTWMQAHDLAERTGSLVLAADPAGGEPKRDLLSWLSNTFTPAETTPLWITSGGTPAVLAGEEVLSVTETGVERKALLSWRPRIGDRENQRNEILNDSYFQNLIATGVTTRKDLDAVAELCRYGEGFIGLSTELLGWEAANSLAQRAGAKVLDPESFTHNSSGDLTRWVASNFADHLAAPVWIGNGGQPHILDGEEVVSVTATHRARKVLVGWKSKTHRRSLSGTLHQGLVLHLDCDEESSQRARDSSGSNNHGKPSGVRWTPNGKIGGAYEFTKDGDALVVPNNPSINAGKLTLAAWIKTSNDDGKWHRIFDKCFDQGFALSIAGEWNEAVNWRGLIHFETSPAVKTGSYGGNITNNRVSDGQWHHVVATFDGIQQQIFVDGEFDSAPFMLRESKSIPANNFDLAIGCNRSNSPPRESGVSFRGIIDEPMMWNRALSPEEVLLLYQSFQEPESTSRRTPPHQ